MATIRYSSYFDKFPKVEYDINRSLINPKYETITNIFFRIRVIREVLNNINSYYVLEVEDGETPEIVADKIYKDSGAGWIILLANQILDPQFDWVMNYDTFQKYIISKYGSVETAQITYHHYDMIIKRTISPDNVITEDRYQVSGNKLTENQLSVPFNYYAPYSVDIGLTADSTDYTVDSTDSRYTVDSGEYLGENGLQSGSLSYVNYLNRYDIAGKTITENVYGEAVTNYDYEFSLNEERRLIKVIKEEYYEQILNEFNLLTNYSSPFRRVVI